MEINKLFNDILMFWKGSVYRAPMNPQVNSYGWSACITITIHCRRFTPSSCLYLLSNHNILTQLTFGCQQGVQHWLPVLDVMVTHQSAEIVQGFFNTSHDDATTDIVWGVIKTTF